LHRDGCNFKPLPPKYNACLDNRQVMQAQEALSDETESEVYEFDEGNSGLARKKTKSSVNANLTFFSNIQPIFMSLGLQNIKINIPFSDGLG